MADGSPLVRGTLDVLVLKALSTSAMHGVEILSWLEARSEGTIEVEDSAIYQALYRMEQRGVVEADWGVTENNRRARYYKITARGRTELRSQTSHWLGFAKAVTRILSAAPGAT